MKRYLVVLTLLGMVFPVWCTGQVRIKDLAKVENAQQVPLVGYGLVLGLDGTGDRASGGRGAVFTVQTISNMLERFGVTVPKNQLRTRNVAAVMVTSKTPLFGRVGTSFDVTVSSLGDASSLEGGVLLMTPLLGMDGTYYAQAQGPVSIGGYNVQTTAGERVQKNHALVGRIPNGAILESEMMNQAFDLTQPIRLLLRDPDFVTATKIAEGINSVYNGVQSNPSGLMGLKDIAQPVSAGVVEISLPDSVTRQDEAVFFIASVETLRVTPDQEARVVINERTGTVVAGGQVKINEVMISHGNLTIHTTERPIISQPQAPFSNSGTTVVAPITETEVTEGSATGVIPATTTVSELATALNQLGIKPRDTIAIFQAIKEAGALNAKLIIM